MATVERQRERVFVDGREIRNVLWCKLDAGEVCALVLDGGVRPETFRGVVTVEPTCRDV